MRSWLCSDNFGVIIYISLCICVSIVLIYMLRFDVLWYVLGVAVQYIFANVLVYIYREWFLTSFEEAFIPTAVSVTFIVIGMLVDKSFVVGYIASFIVLLTAIIIYDKIYERCIFR